MTNNAISNYRKQNRLRMAMWIFICAILVMPWIAMQFTNSVNWTTFDFAVAGALLVGGGAAFELAVRMTSHAGYRLAIGAALLFVVMLIWAEGAVGIFR
jgi:uncharacterized membrane protein